MLLIPLAMSLNRYRLIVVLQADNITRIKEADPASVDLWKLGEPWTMLRLNDIHITYASEADTAVVASLAKEGKHKEIVEFLGRGWKYRPEAGDHDGPPKPLLS
jgi:hypothetical protein